MIAEVRALFPSAYVARDLDRFRVGRSTLLHKLDESEIVREDDDETDTGY